MARKEWLPIATFTPTSLARLRTMYHTSTRGMGRSDSLPVLPIPERNSGPSPALAISAGTVGAEVRSMTDRCWFIRTSPFQGFRCALSMKLLCLYRWERIPLSNHRPDAPGGVGCAHSQSTAHSVSSPPVPGTDCLSCVGRPPFSRSPCSTPLGREIPRAFSLSTVKAVNLGRQPLCHPVSRVHLSIPR